MDSKAKVVDCEEKKVDSENKEVDNEVKVMDCEKREVDKKERWSFATATDFFTFSLTLPCLAVSNFLN